MQCALICFSGRQFFIQNYKTFVTTIISKKFEKNFCFPLLSRIVRSFNYYLNDEEFKVGEQAKIVNCDTQWLFDQIHPLITSPRQAEGIEVDLELSVALSLLNFEYASKRFLEDWIKISLDDTKLSIDHLLLGYRTLEYLCKKKNYIISCTKATTLAFKTQDKMQFHVLKPECNPEQDYIKAAIESKPFKFPVVFTKKINTSLNTFMKFIPFNFASVSREEMLVLHIVLSIIPFFGDFSEGSNATNLITLAARNLVHTDAVLRKRAFWTLKKIVMWRAPARGALLGTLASFLMSITDNDVANRFSVLSSMNSLINLWAEIVNAPQSVKQFPPPLRGVIKGYTDGTTCAEGNDEGKEDTDGAYSSSAQPEPFRADDFSLSIPQTAESLEAAVDNEKKRWLSRFSEIHAEQQRQAPDFPALEAAALVNLCSPGEKLRLQGLACLRSIANLAKLLQKSGPEYDLSPLHIPETRISDAIDVNWPIVWRRHELYKDPYTVDPARQVLVREMTFEKLLSCVTVQENFVYGDLLGELLQKANAVCQETIRQTCHAVFQRLITIQPDDQFRSSKLSEYSPLQVKLIWRNYTIMICSTIMDGRKNQSVAPSDFLNLIYQYLREPFTDFVISGFEHIGTNCVATYLSSLIQTDNNLKARKTKAVQLKKALLSLYSSLIQRLPRGYFAKHIESLDSFISIIRDKLQSFQGDNNVWDANLPMRFNFCKILQRVCDEYCILKELNMETKLKNSFSTDTFVLFGVLSKWSNCEASLVDDSAKRRPPEEMYKDPRMKIAISLQYEACMCIAALLKINNTMVAKMNDVLNWVNFMLTKDTNNNLPGPEEFKLVRKSLKTGAIRGLVNFIISSDFSLEVINDCVNQCFSPTLRTASHYFKVVEDLVAYMSPEVIQKVFIVLIHLGVFMVGNEEIKIRTRALKFLKTVLYSAQLEMPESEIAEIIASFPFSTESSNVSVFRQAQQAISAIFAERFPKYSIVFLGITFDQYDLLDKRANGSRSVDKMRVQERLRNTKNLSQVMSSQEQLLRMLIPWLKKIDLTPIIGKSGVFFDHLSQIHASAVNTGFPFTHTSTPFALHELLKLNQPLELPGVLDSLSVEQQNTVGAAVLFLMLSAKVKSSFPKISFKLTKAFVSQDANIVALIELICKVGPIINNKIHGFQLGAFITVSKLISIQMALLSPKKTAECMLSEIFDKEDAKKSILITPASAVDQKKQAKAGIVLGRGRASTLNGRRSSDVRLKHGTAVLNVTEESIAVSTTTVWDVCYWFCMNFPLSDDGRVSPQFHIALLSEISFTCGDEFLQHLHLILSFALMTLDSSVDFIMNDSKLLLLNLLKKLIISKHTNSDGLIHSRRICYEDAIDALNILTTKETFFAPINEQSEELQDDVEVRTLVKKYVNAFYLFSSDLGEKLSNEIIACACSVLNTKMLPSQAIRALQIYRALETPVKVEHVLTLLNILSSRLTEQSEKSPVVEEVFTTLEHLISRLTLQSFSQCQQLFWFDICLLNGTTKKQFNYGLRLLWILLPFLKDDQACDLLLKGIPEEFSSVFPGLQPLLAKGLLDEATEMDTVKLLVEVQAIPSPALVQPKGNRVMVNFFLLFPFILSALYDKDIPQCRPLGTLIQRNKTLEFATFDGASPKLSSSPSLGHTVVGVSVNPELIGYANALFSKSSKATPAEVAFMCAQELAKKHNKLAQLLLKIAFGSVRTFTALFVASDGVLEKVVHNNSVAFLSIALGLAEACNLKYYNAVMFVFKELLLSTSKKTLQMPKDAETNSNVYKSFNPLLRVTIDKPASFSTKEETYAPATPVEFKASIDVLKLLNDRVAKTKSVQTSSGLNMLEEQPKFFSGTENASLALFNKKIRQKKNSEVKELDIEMAEKLLGKENTFLKQCIVNLPHDDDSVISSRMRSTGHVDGRRRHKKHSHNEFDRTPSPHFSSGSVKTSSSESSELRSSQTSFDQGIDLALSMKSESSADETNKSDQSPVTKPSSGIDFNEMFGEKSKNFGEFPKFGSEFDELLERMDIYSKQREITIEEQENARRSQERSRSHERGGSQSNSESSFSEENDIVTRYMHSPGRAAADKSDGTSQSQDDDSEQMEESRQRRGSVVKRVVTVKPTNDGSLASPKQLNLNPPHIEGLTSIEPKNVKGGETMNMIDSSSSESSDDESSDSEVDISSTRKSKQHKHRSESQSTKASGDDSSSKASKASVKDQTCVDSLSVNSESDNPKEHKEQKSEKRDKTHTHVHRQRSESKALKHTVSVSLAAISEEESVPEVTVSSKMGDKPPENKSHKKTINESVMGSSPSSVLSVGTGKTELISSSASFSNDQKKKKEKSHKAVSSETQDVECEGDDDSKTKKTKRRKSIDSSKDKSNEKDKKKKEAHDMKKTKKKDEKRKESFEDKRKGKEKEKSSENGEKDEKEKHHKLKK